MPHEQLPLIDFALKNEFSSDVLSELKKDKEKFREIALDLFSRSDIYFEKVDDDILKKSIYYQKPKEAILKIIRGMLGEENRKKYEDILRNFIDEFEGAFFEEYLSIFNVQLEEYVKNNHGDIKGDNMVPKLMTQEEDAGLNKLRDYASDKLYPGTKKKSVRHFRSIEDGLPKEN
jgi:hypothetical protein